MVRDEDDRAVSQQGTGKGMIKEMPRGMGVDGREHVVQEQKASRSIDGAGQGKPGLLTTCRWEHAEYGPRGRGDLSGTYRSARCLVRRQTSHRRLPESRDRAQECKQRGRVDTEPRRAGIRKDCGRDGCQAESNETRQSNAHVVLDAHRFEPGMLCRIRYEGRQLDGTADNFQFAEQTEEDCASARVSQRRSLQTDMAGRNSSLDVLPLPVGPETTVNRPSGKSIVASSIAFFPPSAPAYRSVAPTSRRRLQSLRRGSSACSETSPSAKKLSMREIDTPSWRMRIPKPGIWSSGPRILWQTVSGSKTAKGEMRERERTA